MRKNRLIIFVLSVLACVTTYSQTQEGYVKTLGRPNKKGTALSSVSIKVKGEHNPVTSKKDGRFSLLLTNKKNGDSYSLQEVRKNGYELNETGIIGRQYAFSDRAPLTIVMVSSAQLQADKQRIENNAFRTAEKNYKAKLALLEEQKEKNIISIEKYREELQNLQDKFEKYQLMIDGLAEHYAHVDHDVLDENGQKINTYIENGELERADSLLQLLFDPIDVLKRNKEALTKLNEQISQANELMDKANEDWAALLKQQEKDAEHLYQLYTIALSRFDNDKARFYIETRAELDSTNVDWQIDAGNYNKYIASYDRALLYFNRSLLLAQKEEDGGTMISTCLEKNAEVYFAKGDLNTSKKFYEDALAWRRDSIGDTTNAAGIYQGLATLYSKKEEYKTASDYYVMASNMYIESNNIHNNDFAVLLLSMGESLLQVEDYKNATESILMSISIWSELGTHNDNLSSAANLLGRLYRLQGNFTEALNWQNKALKISQDLWGNNHTFIANAYSEIGLVYSDQGDYSKAIDYHKKSLEINLKLLGEDGIGVGADYNNIAICYANTQLYSLAIEYFNRSLNAYLSTYGYNHSLVARILENMGMTYEKKKDYTSALSCYLKALPIFEKSYGHDHQLVVNIYNLVAFSYCNINDPMSALRYYKVALDICKRTHTENDSNKMIAIEYNNLYHTYIAIIEMNDSEQYLADFRSYMSEMIFVGSVVDNYPAYNQGLRGEYFLLEYNDWKYDSHKSLFKHIDALRGKPKCLVLLKDGRITAHNFDDIAGIQFRIKHIEKNEKQEIEELYRKWKRE